MSQEVGIAVCIIAKINPFDEGIRLTRIKGNLIPAVNELPPVYIAYTPIPPDSCLARGRENEPIVAKIQRDPKNTFLAVASRVYHPICDTCRLLESCSLVEKALAISYPNP